MTRNATPHFDSFDPEVIEAARDVAARAGVPLETWIASVVPQAAGQGGRRHRRRHRGDGGGQAEPRQDARHETRQDVGQEGGPEAGAERRANHRPERRESDTRSDAPAYAPGFAALMSRLDGLDRAIEAERRAADEAEGRRLNEIEARIDRALKAGPVGAVTERLGDIERRMAQLGDQVTAGRPPGRRGRAGSEEIRDAVEEIRQRRRELSGEAQPDGGIVGGMRRDLARRLETGGEGAQVRSAAVAELQNEIGRLRDSIDRLATARDVGALEQAVVSLATGVERARAGTDLGAIAAPIEAIRAQVERLAEDVATNVHNRVAADVQRLAGRLDVVAASGTPESDRPAVTGLFGELDEIRRLIAGLAGPERIQGLAQGLQAVSAQIAQLHAVGADGGLLPILEEIRSDMKGTGPAALTRQIEALAAKVDALHARAENHPVDTLVDRIERLEQPAGASADMGSIHGMLRSLAEKVDRVGALGAPEGLDALEKQVLTLADRIAAPRGADPALTGLARTMDDLLRQVSALRESSPSEAVIERAARSAVAQSLKASGTSADPGEIGLLRASLADMQARQAAADQRLSTTLEGVQSALDRLVGRLGPAKGAPAPRGPSLDERLMASTSPDAARAGRRPPVAHEPALDLSRADDGLLEPGAPRPGRERQGEAASGEAAMRRPPRERPREPSPAPEGDIKTSFIAAARRAAQAAQAELAAEAPPERQARSRGAVPAAAIAGQGRIARLRAEIDRRRRPLLLGLAAIVLVLGALQAISMRSADEAPRPAPVAQTPAADPAPSAPRTEAPKEARPAADPQTTQALANPPPAEARPAPAKSALPPISGMNTLTADLGNVPPGLAKLKQAALDGDGEAIWELAAREADGRGMPRDLSIAAKLFEKMASAGYAPAQYKLAGHYEKGSGLVRDLAQAKLWYGRAAEQGHARAMHNLAVLYAENPGANGKPDFASAASWFRQGAEFGIRDSQYNLAVLYARGLGLTQDLVQSYAWFSAAAGQGDEDAAKKRDDVATKLSPADLASAKSLAANFKPRKVDGAVNDPPAPREAAQAPMSLLGVPAPSANAFTPPARKAI